MLRAIVAGAVWLLALSLLAGCSATERLDWAGKDVLAVGDVDGKAYLLAQKAGGPGPVAAEDLTSLGVSPDSSVRVLHSGAVRLLVWTTANSPTHVARLDVVRGAITRTPYSFDAGLLTLGGDTLYIGRALGAGARIECFSLTAGRVVGSVRIPFVPDELVAGDGALIALHGGTGSGRGVVIRDDQMVSGFRIRPGGAIAGASLVGGRVLAATGTFTSAAGSTGLTALASGRAGADLGMVRRVNDPQLVAALDGRRAVVGGVVAGRRCLLVVDARTGRTTRSVPLRSDATLLALLVRDPRHVTALQSDGWTEVDVDTGSARSLPLPGTVISTQ